MSLSCPSHRWEGWVETVSRSPAMHEQGPRTGRAEKQPHAPSGALGPAGQGRRRSFFPGPLHKCLERLNQDLLERLWYPDRRRAAGPAHRKLDAVFPERPRD